MTNNRFAALALLMGLFACHSGKKMPLPNGLERKSEPYDHLTFQRTYPDTVFNWTAWRQLIESAQLPTVAERSGNCAGGTVSNTPWTLQGPANYAGRVNALAVQPGNENTVLAGFAGGGIFKTTDAGATWKPVFDQFAQLSIGHIAFDPNNPNTVYAGTGDVNMPSILYNGDGVYKSTDAGETWQYIGLKQAGVVSKIIVHPTDPQTLWVSTMGNPYVRNTERGVYKTTNGGQTWTKVLYQNNHSGCSSLVMSAANPQVLFASFWDRLRNSSESFVAGPSAKVYKSSDGGETWAQLGGGLPTSKNGRTGLAISQQNPDKVYALFIDTLSTTGSLHLTTDGGTSWTNLNVASLEDACADFGWYFGKMSLNPANDNDLFFHGILLHRRLANGSWQVAAGGHADSHDLAFCPSGRRYWANDGGVYRNEPNQQLWVKSGNLPATQVYRVAHNPLLPNTYWLGAQDNGIKRGSAQAVNTWSDVIAADGFNCAFSPTSTDTFWVELQNGTIQFTGTNGANWSSAGSAFGTTDRVGWDAPFFRSEHPPYTFYGATYRVLTSSNGSGFGAGSGDLTDGVIIAPRFHVVSCLSESPLQAGRLFAGTSDANVWWRSTNGTWTNITAGLPNRYVTSVVGSPTVLSRIFATHSGFRDDEYIPHIHRSEDNGQTWSDISGDLPPVPVNQLFVLPFHADSILVAATDAGVFATKNGGTNWYRLGQGMPSVPAFDLKHNKTQRLLIAGTHGRGVWTFPLDSITQTQTLPPTLVGAEGQVKSVSGAGVAHVTFPNLPTHPASDTSGHYTLSGLTGCSTTVFRPYRNDMPFSGLSAYDLILISRHILNLEPLNSPYKMIAADANRSKTITTYDIVQLRKILLGTDTAFTQNTSWRFVRADYVFQNMDNALLDSFPEQVVLPLDQSDVTLPDFIGVKIGDIDQDGSSYLIDPQASDRGLPTYPVWVNAATRSGDVLELDLELDWTNAAGIQFTLEFDAQQLEWLTPVLGTSDMTLDDHFNLQNSAQGRIRFVYERPTDGQSGYGPLMRLRFKPLKPNVQWANALRLTSSSTAARVYDPQGRAAFPALVTMQNHDGLLVFPNPSAQGNGWVQTTKAGQLRVQDVQGRVLWQQDVPARTPISLEGFQPGTYFLSLLTAEGQRIQRKWVVVWYGGLVDW